jgi:hypothetical protein
MRTMRQISEEQNKAMLKTELKDLYIQFDKEQIIIKKQELKKLIRLYEERIIEITRREKIIS